MFNYLHKIILFFICVTLVSKSYSDSYHFLIGRGLSVARIQTNTYFGYNIYAKSLIKLTENLSFGTGLRYEELYSGQNTTLYNNNKYTFSSLQAGGDFAYSLNFEQIKIFINPFLYYALRDNWQRNTVNSQGTTTSQNPQTQNHYAFGTNFDLLFILNNFFYFGAGAGYSLSTIKYNNYYDNNNNYYSGSSGFFHTVTMNYIIGLYL